MKIPLSPLPMEQWAKLTEREQQLQAIGDTVAYWLKFVTKEREVEGLETDGNTHVMLDGGNAPPHWPTVATLTRWLQVIRAGVDEAHEETQHPRP
jgi:hypothetical protein